MSKATDASYTAAAAATPCLASTKEGDALTGGTKPSKSSVASDIGDHGAVEHLILSVPFSLDDPFSSSLDRASKYYLYYYSKCVCKLFIMYDSNKNPLRNLIPAALDNPALFNSIAALSARHLANADQSFHQSDTDTRSEFKSAHHDALLFKYKALQGISQSLNNSTSCRKDTTVASAFLLIFLDLLESGSDKWNFHLEGVKKLIAPIQLRRGSQTGRGQDLGDTVQGIRDFIIRQIYLIDTLGATYTRPKLLSNSTSLRQSKTPLPMSVDKSYLGCPENLLEALQSFSACRDVVANAAPLDETTLYSLIQEINTVLDSTRSFDCNSWASKLPQPHSSSAQDIRMLSTLAQSYKIGTMIYGKRVLSTLMGENISQDDLVYELIGMVEILKGDESLFKCILWPMFVAGLESRQQPQRDYVISCLEKFWFETKCINVVNAGNLLRKFWQQEDSEKTSSSHWIFNIGQLGGDWLLI
ncbi:hypothetical protein BBP40_007882 [Aspergillus hancockii]|nr:hypothetical protein BBP40_007882 [Aspergillus hancockii]